MTFWPRHSFLPVLGLVATVSACADSTSGSGGATAGTTGTGGATMSGGKTGTGGSTNQGGTVSTGGASTASSATGGVAGTGGRAATGGSAGGGGGTGGATGRGGATSTGGKTAAAGGAMGTGGTIGRGGVTAVGGTPGTGGARLDGGPTDAPRDSGSADRADAADGPSADLGTDGCAGDACSLPGAVSRPPYNTGKGFFVSGGKLYDANGVEFRIRGVNKCHYDAPWPGIPKAHANAIRWGVPLWMAASVSSKLMQDSVNAKIAPIAGVWYTAGTWADADNVTCKEDTAHLTTAVDQWVAQATTFQPFERYVLINLANEWGPSKSTTWRDAYISAVARMRAAGYLATLVIDAGGCGQDANDIITYGQAIFDSDAQHNILFSIHIYGNWSSGGGESWQTDLASGLDGLAKTGLPVVVGEFGPGRNIGPSPTAITPGQVITAAESHGMGWLAWAWDDPASNVKDTDFALSYTGDYTSSADLTTFGKDVVENPGYGLLHLAQPATVF